MFKNFVWHCQPPKWEIKDKSLIVETACKTDFWRHTFYGLYVIMVTFYIKQLRVILRCWGMPVKIGNIRIKDIKNIFISDSYIKFIENAKKSNCSGCLISCTPQPHA